MISKRALSVALLFAVSGCQHAASSRFTYKDLDQQQAPQPKPGTLLLTADKVTQDIDLLLYALDRGYAGKDFVPAESWAQMTQQPQMKGPERPPECRSYAMVERRDSKPWACLQECRFG